MVEHVTRIKSGTTTNVGVSAKIWKNMFMKKVIFEILLHFASCWNDKYLASVIVDSEITCDKIIEETKTLPTR